MNRRSWLVALCLLAFPAFATQIEFRSLPQLAQDSQLVVQGQVGKVRSFWNESHTRILTEVEIAIQSSHKGTAPSNVRLLQVGGVVDGVRMTVHGAPTWPLGQDVLLFLEPSLPGNYRLSGFTQGRFELELDATTGEWIAKRPLYGMEIAGKRAENVALPLDELLRQAFGEEGGR